MARWATDDDHDLIDGYAAFCHEIGVSDRALRDRLHLGRRFLAEHPDLVAWMDRPTRSRLADLQRIRAWPLLSWAGLSGRVQLDLDLLCAKDLGAMSATLRRLCPEEFSSLWEVARHLGWSYYWSRSVIDQFVPAVLAWSQRRVGGIDAGCLDAFEGELGMVTSASATTRRQWHGRLFGLRQLLFELGQLPELPVRGPTAAPLAERARVVPAAGIRESIVRYVEARASVLAQSSVNGLLDDLVPFGEFLGRQFPEIETLRKLERSHVEAYLIWNRQRTWRGRVAHDRVVSASVVHSSVLSLRNFLDDVTLWGWTDRPSRRLVFATDVPRLPRPLPRALAPDVDAALMAAVAELDDLFARVGITLLRRTVLRLGECLDLEVHCVVDYGAAGAWLRVPLGKLKTERMVPLDEATVALLDRWVTERASHRPHMNPATAAPTDFLFTERGQRLKGWRIRAGLRTASARAGLAGPDGTALNVTPHQLRHTYATELANAGMSLQALMALLGHVTPEMTLRYATLASPTLRAAYDEAIGKVRRSIPVAPAGRPVVPLKVEWIASEFLKTRLGTGMCSRHLAAGPCPYANVCETCDNFDPKPEHASAIQDQLTDVRLLREDATGRGWRDEEQRHRRVEEALTAHLERLERA